MGTKEYRYDAESDTYEDATDMYTWEHDRLFIKEHPNNCIWEAPINSKSMWCQVFYLNGNFHFNDHWNPPKKLQMLLLAGAI